MTATPELLRKIAAGGYEHAVLVFVDDEGFPLGVASDFEVDAGRGVLRLRVPAGAGVAPPDGGSVNVIVSHIRPYPDVGYDQRRYVQVWGRVRRDGDALEVVPDRGHTWNEDEVPFFQYNEVSVPQGHRYLGEVSAEQGRRVRPRLAGGWLFLRATRLPFLTATIVPVLLGVAAAGVHGRFELGLAALTLLGAACIHLGLNVTNDVFDTMSGADAANTTPTQFSGGSRVIHYGLLSLRSMALMAAGFYATGMAIGLYLAATRGWELLWIGAFGVAISIAYTAPPIRLVHRGIGEITVALGFGPIVLLGAYFVQAQRLSWEAAYLSIPVAILIALVLYVNEVPDRAGDAAAGKRTLPVRLSKEAVIRGYVAAVAATYAVIAAGAVSGILPRPAIVGLATIPLARRVARGLRESYDDPYALMPTMATNISLHLFTGVLLFAGYLVAIVAGRVLADPPLWLT
ncbi:MAG: prenyltransferase [Actinomycetota bacterium]|nr:prenyltransferase [Actinomycetota bacterium]